MRDRLFVVEERILVADFKKRLRLEDVDDPLARFSFHASALSACRDDGREVRRPEPLELPNQRL